MTTTINAKQLRASLPEVVERVRRGGRFTVIYRSSPAFQIVPVDDAESPRLPLKEDALYRAKPLDLSTERLTAAEHDATLYGRR